MRDKKWQIPKQKVNEIKYRDINSTTTESFASRLADTDWEDVLHCKDPDQAYDTFIEKYKNIYNQCFPYITKVKPRKARKPWITSDCLKAIKKKTPSTNAL